MDEQKVFDIAGRVIDRIVDEDEKTVVVLSTGIRLKCKPVPPLYFQSIATEFAKTTPVPPMAESEEKGRQEPNPLDPDYQQALAAHEARQELATQSVLMSMGTEVEYVPEGMYRPEDKEWETPLKEMAEISGIPWECDDNPESRKRYLSWLRYYAIGDMTDMSNVAAVPLYLAGLTESEVVRAMDSFRSYVARRADSDGSAAPADANGNRPNRAARRAGSAV